MKTLHVAAMPYPSHQGTQALIHQMLSALSAEGHETHLLCYAHGAFSRSASYTLHRISPCFPARSLRSGPSFEKLVLDAALARTLSKLASVLRPDAVIAHHVEAALAALSVGVSPLLFVAHTSLAAELPSYFPSRYRWLLGRLGARLDRFLCRRAGRVLSVSPLLATLLREAGAPRVFPVHVPWPLSAPISAVERNMARAEFGFSERDEVVLYAGNLDAYQGLGPLLEGLESLSTRRASLRFLVGTESDSAALLRSLRHSVLGRRTQVASLASEPKRRALHAAADVVAVPRASPGGVPVKLLDALARGKPVIAARRAGAGLPVASACTLIDDADPVAWRIALEAHFAEPNRGLSASLAGRAALSRDHCSARFVADMTQHVTALRYAARRPVESAPSGARAKVGRAIAR